MNNIKVYSYTTRGVGIDKGQELREEIERELQKEGQVRLDFTGVNLLTHNFITTWIDPLTDNLNHIIFLSNTMSSEVKEKLENVLQDHNMKLG